MVEIDNDMPCTHSQNSSHFSSNILEKGQGKRKSVSMEVEDGNGNEMEDVKLIEDERTKQGEVRTIKVFHLGTYH